LLAQQVAERLGDQLRQPVDLAGRRPSQKLLHGPGMTRSVISCTRPFIRLKSRRSRSSGLSSSLRSSRSGVIHTFSSSFLIIASMERSWSTTVHTQQPNRLVPQLGVVVSTTSGHSPPSDAPWYMPRSDL